MKLSIVIIGDEILLGQVTDTNSGAIARAFGPKGWEVSSTSVVGDDGRAIASAVTKAMAESDLVITTGGLGPTKDDITKKVLADYFGGEMKRDPEVEANIVRVFDRRGLKLNDYTRDQALVPASCRVIQNLYGTAPIMWFEKNGKVLISMPGVPFETEGMLRSGVVDEVMARFAPDSVLLHHTLIVNGISESELAMQLSEWETALPCGVHLAYLPAPGFIRLRLDGVDVSPIEYERKVEELKELVSDCLVYDGDATPAEILLGKLRAKGYTVSTAESCTGGNIAHAITSIAGSSECFNGSVVSYSNDVKRRVLGVSQYDLDAAGAVSQPVVVSMAQGVSDLIATDCAIATSGIAGPGGGTDLKPVGTVWISVLTPEVTLAECKHFAGDRSRVIERATTEAILMLAKLL